MKKNYKNWSIFQVVCIFLCTNGMIFHEYEDNIIDKLNL